MLKRSPAGKKKEFFLLTSDVITYIEKTSLLNALEKVGTDLGVAT